MPMRVWWWVGGGVVVLTAAASLAWCSARPGGWVQQRPSLTVNLPPPPRKVVQVDTPQENAVVTSPLTVSGTAPGPWFFEATLPVSLVDETGKEIARAPAQAQDDWVTEGPVRFSTTLTFIQPSTTTGYLVVSNDNPSGLPENSKRIRVKVRFK